METVNLLPADTYIVKNATILDNESRLVLIKLYQPIIGAVPINLYFTLWSNLDTSQIVSTEYTHHNLMALMRIRLEDILEAREKLEAIGLLKTYLRKGSINNYIYELYSPLEPQEFIDNPILSTTLASNLGTSEFEKLLNYFKVPDIDLKEYQDISATFGDTFEVTNSVTVTDTRDIRKIKQIDLLVDARVDLNGILSLIPNEVLNHRSITKEIKSLIYKLAYIYNLDDQELLELIRNSINEKKIIDKALLRMNCHNYYTFEHQNITPSLVYKKDPDYLRTKVSSNSKRAKIIHTFETTTPYDFLSGKNKGVRPSKSDLALIEVLMVDYSLTPGVVNVLIDYVLRINDNKLTKNFVITIANQWKRSNIKTVEEAMELCKKENRHKNKQKLKVVKKEEKPDWFNKNIEQEEASSDDIATLEASLNDL